MVGSYRSELSISRNMQLLALNSFVVKGYGLTHIKVEKVD